MRYLAYLLRLWQVECDGAQTWRATLENAHTGERHAFGSLDTLFGFLKELASTPEETRNEEQGGS